jgi:glycerol-3-phosphate acyltransferase PlsY
MDLGSLLTVVGPIVAGYFIGGIPFGIVVARVVGGPDPRTLGSGRTGGANVMRALGPRAAAVAGLLDAAKGAVVVLLAMVVGAPPIVVVLAALAAIVGHSRSPYIGFQGGRGVATAWGALVPIQPLVALLLVPVFGGVLYATRISSLASLTCSVVGAIGLTIAVLVVPMPVAYLGYAIGAAVLIFLFHADNIQRLLAGQERRIDRPTGGGR